MPELSLPNRAPAPAWRIAVVAAVDLWRAGLRLGVAAVGLAGCVGTGVGVPIVVLDGSAVPETFAEIQTEIFDTTCAPQCHGGGAASKGLSLEAGRSRENLVGVPSVEVPELLRVAPGQASESYLVAKLTTMDARRIGSRMPRTGPPYLSTAQVHAIERWINAGAAADWVDGEDQDSGGQDSGLDTGEEAGEETAAVGRNP
jgi:hypothetical protein